MPRVCFVFAFAFAVDANNVVASWSRVWSLWHVACGTLLASSRRQKQLRYAHTSTASRGVQLASRIAIVASCDSTVVVHRSRSSSQSESGTDPAAAPGANRTRNMLCILRIVVSVVFCVPCVAIRCRLARSAPIIKTDKSTHNFELHKMCNSFL